MYVFLFVGLLVCLFFCFLFFVSPSSLLLSHVRSYRSFVLRFIGLDRLVACNGCPRWLATKASLDAGITRLRKFVVGVFKSEKTVLHVRMSYSYAAFSSFPYPHPQARAKVITGCTVQGGLRGVRGCWWSQKRKPHVSCVLLRGSIGPQCPSERQGGRLCICI